jgi:hypothetical protein
VAAQRITQLTLTAAILGSAIAQLDGTIVSVANAASVSSFHLGVVIAAALLALGALIGAAGIRNPPAPAAEA